jgi:Na+-translocating ferredoxin:NAD+ oxidoreductase RNF subunit RnfB
MPERTHGFWIDETRCHGRGACMRSCPTQAIRVRDGKAALMPELCIDCGTCLPACPSGAIQATTTAFAEFDRFKYRVAVPTPVLFGQFPVGISPAHVAAGLRGAGLDAVWDFAPELALTNRAIADYVRQWRGPFPLVSVSCPVIVRLVQVLYPNMIEQLIRIQPPRELAGRTLKRKYAAQFGIAPDEVAAIYITPCQAKTISIHEPAERAESSLNGAIGICDVYNAILAFERGTDKDPTLAAVANPARSVEALRWATSQAQGSVLRGHRYMSVTGLSNVIQVFDDVEKGKLRNIEYLECHACWGGCGSGNLTVDNSYVTLSKIHGLLSQLPEHDAELEAEVERRYPTEDFSLKGELRPRAAGNDIADLKERVRRIKIEEKFGAALPGLNCGLCGAPTCKTFARDVAAGRASQQDCVFISDERMKRLRALYSPRKDPPATSAP